MFQVFWRSIKDLFDELFLLILTNLVWCVISLPLLGLAGFASFQGFPLPATILAVLAVLPLGPATAGMYTIAQRVNEGRTGNLGQFFAGMREYAKLSWQIYGIWMVGFVAIVFNLAFYNQLGSAVGAVLQVVFLYLFVIWFALLVYLGPLMLLQTDKRLRVIARNAALMAFGRPIFTLVTLVLMVLLIVVSLIPGVFIIPLLILFAFLSVWSFRATTKLIADAEERLRLEEEKATAGQIKYSTDKGRSGQIKPRD